MDKIRPAWPTVRRDRSVVRETPRNFRACFWRCQSAAMIYWLDIQLNPHAPLEISARIIECSASSSAQRSDVYAAAACSPLQLQVFGVARRQQHY